MLKRVRNVAAVVAVALAIPGVGAGAGVDLAHKHAVKDNYGHIHTVADETGGGITGGLGGLVADGLVGVGLAYYKGRKRGIEIGEERAAKRGLGE